jgi:hypothetical protein
MYQAKTLSWSAFDAEQMRCLVEFLKLMNAGAVGCGWSLMISGFGSRSRIF